MYRYAREKRSFSILTQHLLHPHSRVECVKANHPACSVCMRDVSMYCEPRANEGFTVALLPVADTARVNLSRLAR